MGTPPNVHEGLIQAEASSAGQNGTTEAFAREAALSGLMMIGSPPILDRNIQTANSALMFHLSESIQVPETVLARL
jgi:hypothetical protein